MEEEEDVVDFVLDKTFPFIDYKLKCQIKEKQPQPIMTLEQTDKTSFRRFQNSWYEKYPWLAGSVVRQKLYCFPCLLFGGESEWSRNGVMTVKNFERKAQKHQISKFHIQNREHFHMLGRDRIEHTISEEARSSTVKHNEMVKSNREILGRCIDDVCLMPRQELAFRGHHESSASASLNKRNCLETGDLFAEEQHVMRDPLESHVKPDPLEPHVMLDPIEFHSVFNGTSIDFQDDLVATVTDLLNDKIRAEISEAEFISVQVDETTDVSCKFQLSIILRYCIEDRIEERFIGFFDVSKDKKAELLSRIILNALKLWKCETKLVCQTYDGPSVMASCHSGVQHFVRHEYPHALFIHCYCHQLNLVLLHSSKTIKQVRLFISSLTGFHLFFNQSAKRTSLLMEQGFKLPCVVKTRNYHSGMVSAIKEHFSELRCAFNHIIEDSDWDSITVNMAVGLNNQMENPLFVFLLVLYSNIFVLTDHVFNILRTKCLSDVELCNSEVKWLIHSVQEMRNDNFVRLCCEEGRKLNNNLVYSDELIDESLRALAFQILDSQITQLEVRFKDFESIDFLELLNEDRFAEYKITFPEKKLEQLLKTYPFFHCHLLKNELKIIYSDPHKYKSPQDLLKYIFNNGLSDIYGQLSKLLRLILTLPITTASNERSMSALKRVKSYLRSLMENTRLSNLATLSIENKLLKSLSNDCTFKDNVIDRFAASKNCDLDLAYISI